MEVSPFLSVNGDNLIYGKPQSTTGDISVTCNLSYLLLLVM